MTSKNLTIYEIYPRSFFDSNGDGIGDLQGIIEQLPYLQDLGIDAIWLAPVFVSPQVDFGYDISDHYEIAPEYGTLADLRQLIDRAHQLGLKVIFDLVLNHTSDQHKWFKESRASRDKVRSDWYIWRDKPNNWKSLTGGSGWHFCPERGQWYYASFLPFQPDLNYRNPAVKAAMFDLVRHWLAWGVDGFRLDIFNVLFKDASFRDNPFSFKLFPTEADMSGFLQSFQYTVNQPESFEFARELRELVKGHGDKLLIGEVFGDNAIIKKYLGDKCEGLTHVFDFKMLNYKFSADWFRQLIIETEASFPAPYSPVYVFSNHDRMRSAVRVGGDIQKAKLLHFFQLTVRGTVCLYYGEEIGMQGRLIPKELIQDSLPKKFPHFLVGLARMFKIMLNRDEARTPMQWCAAAQNGGFSTSNRTWLPLPDVLDVSVEQQSGDPNSLLRMIRQLLNLRKSSPALSDGSIELCDSIDGLLIYKRRADSEVKFIALNFGRSVAIYRAQKPIAIKFAIGSAEFDAAMLKLGPLSAVIFEEI
jgi:oligo-1,6-glucosidase/alpha-glucosidase